MNEYDDKSIDIRDYVYVVSNIYDKSIDNKLDLIVEIC